MFKIPIIQLLFIFKCPWSITAPSLLLSSSVLEASPPPHCFSLQVSLKHHRPLTASLFKCPWSITAPSLLLSSSVLEASPPPLCFSLQVSLKHHRPLTASLAKQSLYEAIRILLTKITAVQNEVVVSHHRVCGLYLWN